MAIKGGAVWQPEQWEDSFWMSTVLDAHSLSRQAKNSGYKSNPTYPE